MEIEIAELLSVSTVKVLRNHQEKRFIIEAKQHLLCKLFDAFSLILLV